MTEPWASATTGASTVRLRDVARRAGVSHQTVSRVINNLPNIREETRQRVLRAIDELHYRPNPVARALARGRTLRMGMLIESSSHYGPMAMLRGLESAARQAGYSATAFFADGNRSGEFSRGFEFLMAQDVDAMGIVVPRIDLMEELEEMDLPRATVILKSAGGSKRLADRFPHLRMVSVDQGRGVRLAVEHLLARGHTQIAHLAGPKNWFDARNREREWRAVLAEHGLETPPLLRGDWTADSGYRAAAEFVHSGIDATAIFAANDQMAFGLMHGLHEAGVSVPEQVSVVGFDDIPECRHFLPPLTTVRQDFTGLGRLGIAQLLAELDAGPEPEASVLEPELVVRESVRDISSDR